MFNMIVGWMLVAFATFAALDVALTQVVCPRGFQCAWEYCGARDPEQEYYSSYVNERCTILDNLSCRCPRGTSCLVDPNSVEHVFVHRHFYYKYEYFCSERVREPQVKDD